MRTLCPSCSVGLNLPEHLAGKAVACPKCKTSFVAPTLVPAAGPPVSQDIQPGIAADEVVALATAASMLGLDPAKLARLAESEHVVPAMGPAGIGYRRRDLQRLKHELGVAQASPPAAEPQQTNDGWVDEVTAAALLGVSGPAFGQLLALGKVSPFLFGSEKRYSRSEVLQVGASLGCGAPIPTARVPQPTPAPLPQAAPSAAVCPVLDAKAEGQPAWRAVAARL